MEIKIIIPEGTTYREAQSKLCIDENFYLIDSLIYMMDYGEEVDGVIRDKHNGLQIEIRGIDKLKDDRRAD